MDLAILDAQEHARKHLRGELKPPPIIEAPTWADRYRIIVKGPEKGPWRSSRTPYLHEPLLCTDQEHPAWKIVLQFASQLGKTEVLYNAMFKRIHLDPMDMLFVQPTLNDAKDHSRQRFAPTVAKMRCLDDKLAPVGSRDEQNTWQTKEIRGGATLFFAGANSARSLASKPLPFALCDEIDGWPDDVDGEGDPVQLVRARLSNFPLRKLILSSTPTIEGFSRIDAEYKASDQREYHVPCPHCGERQVLIWGEDKEYGVKWLFTATGEPRPNTAVYICRHCGAAIEELEHKTEMLAEGIWVPQNPHAFETTLTAGFKLSKIYSPVGWESWATMANDWIQAKKLQEIGDKTKMKAFVNTGLGETYKDQGERADLSDLQKRAKAWDYPLRQVHERCYVCTIGVDVQSNRLEASIWAWGRGWERHLVDTKVIYGDPASPETDTGSPWAELTEYRRTPVLHPSGNAAPVLATMVDSGGHHTNAVYVYARAHQREGVFAVKGHSKPKQPIVASTPSLVDVDMKGRRLPKGVQLWMVGSDTAKEEIYGRLRTAKPGPGYVHLSTHLPDETIKQLTSETLVTKLVKGRPRQEWVKPASARNEELDKAVYALAGAHKLGMDRWREGDWRKWERRVAGHRAAPPPPPTPAPAPATDSTMAALLPPAPPPPVQRKGRRTRGTLGGGFAPW